MRITLNSSIPEGLRSKAEAIVRTHAPEAEILWAESRFPRLVILMEPLKKLEEENVRGSIFESPAADDASLAATAIGIEEQLLKLLAGPRE